MELCYLLTTFLCATVGAASSTPPLGFERRALLRDFTRRADNSTCSTCSLYETAPTTSAPKPNVWKSVSTEDNVAVWQLLHDPASGLNLTDVSVAGINDNYLFYIDTVPMNKSDVLAYLDSSGPEPAQYARAIIFEGGKEEPVSQEYMVGPLPVTSETTIQKLDYIYNGGSGGSVPFNGRTFDAMRTSASDPLLIDVMSNITDITTKLLGGVWYGDYDDRSTLTSITTSPSSFDGTQAFRIVVFKFPGPASYLRSVDFYLMIDVTGTDTSLYKLKGIVTNTRFFPTIEDLRTAFEAGELTEEFYVPEDYDWALVNYDQEMGKRDLEEKFAPQSIELGGKRYKLDNEQKYVEYLGWTFYVAHTLSLGVMFYDIRFKGERILYELSMQEAAAQYGGFQPKASTTLYHDTYYQLGGDLYPLVEGFDCPFGSSFWNVSTHDGNSTIVSPDAICIFESDPGFPLSRHRAVGGTTLFGFENLGVVKASVLTLRSIATVGNYDYLFDYAFHVDGSLEIIVRASGYLQSSFYYPDQGKWGPRIQEAVQGSLHDHVITWKADFDILDAENSLEVTELRAAPTEQPWWPELGVFEQIELNTYNMETEQQFDWAVNAQTMYSVNHANATNKWGTKRGYRIVPGRSNIKLSTLNSPFSRNNSQMSKTQLAVTRQHDTEPFANSVQNLNMPWKPQQDFSKFFDDESVDGEDLVVWFNLGMHHFTRSEDVPVTLYSQAVSSIMFAPQNFFDRAQDGDILNRRWITPDENSTSGLAYATFGIELPQCKIALTEGSVKPLEIV
ncbi:copper amine oxidase [Xylariales sp. AK1849]|nr:copper amine oxidase [Xylariales sp. AK1849]